MERVLMVASTGGHLSELYQLRDDVSEGADVRWATFDTDQSRSLLDDQDVLRIRDVPPRGYLPLLWVLPSALWAMWRYKPDRVVSTGAGIALAFLPFARLFNAEGVYVESAARINGPSVTGRLLSLMPWVQTYTQYSNRVNPRWWYRWSIFEKFKALQRPRRRAVGEPARVLVMLGTMEFPFDRLVKSIRDHAPEGTEIVWQLGSTPIPPDLPGHAFSTIASADLEKYAAQCTMIVSHAGVGSAICALESGIRPILVPRLRAFGEHVDEHQVQVARYLESKGLAMCIQAGDLTSELFDYDYRSQPVAIGEPEPVAPGGSSGDR